MLLPSSRLQERPDTGGSGAGMKRFSMDRLYCALSCLFGAVIFFTIHNTNISPQPTFRQTADGLNSSDFIPLLNRTRILLPSGLHQGFRKTPKDDLGLHSVRRGYDSILMFRSINSNMPNGTTSDARADIHHSQSTNSSFVAKDYSSIVSTQKLVSDWKTDSGEYTSDSRQQDRTGLNINTNGYNPPSPARTGDRIAKVYMNLKKETPFVADQPLNLGQRSVVKPLAGPLTPPSQDSRPNFEVVFKTKPLVIWTNDYHIATTQDIRNLLEPIGVEFIDKSLTPKCKLYNSCADNLTVIGSNNALTLDPSLIPKFYERYRDDWQMQTVDAFVCYHPTAMCELFMPFNKSIIIIASTRFELGRFEASRWKQWIDNLVTIAKDPKNFVGANNLYDAQYIKYFTGLDVPVVPSYCGYTKGDYNPTRPGFLTFAGRQPPSPFHTFFRYEYEATCRHNNCSDELKLVHFRTLYPFFEFQDLASHKGIIFVPYQVSIMTIFELYRMNIPMFFPSLELLSSWQLKHLVVKERTFLMYRFHIRSNASLLPPHPSMANVPDPNNDSDLDAIKYWFRFADFYQLPHIIYFNSVYDLITKLRTTNLQEVSARMREYNKYSHANIMAQWTAILKNVAKYSQNHPS